MPKGEVYWLVSIRGGVGIETVLTWANVLAEKKAKATIMDVHCMFASLMIKRRGCWLRWGALRLQRKKRCNKI